MHRDWNDGWSGGWLWMTIMMVIFWAVVIWIVVTLIRHTNRAPHTHAAGPAATASQLPTRQTPQDLLAERLARGDIEPDDYRQRLEALGHQPSRGPT